MIKYFILIVCCLLFIPGVLLSQEVVISDFPVGVGTNIGSEIFQQNYDALKKVADTLHKYPLAHAVITGSADGENYREYHDTKNAGIALSRAHALRIFMTEVLKVNSSQFVISTEEIRKKDPKNRYVSVRVVRETIDLDDRVAGKLDLINERIAALENKPPIEKHFTEIQKESAPTVTDDFGVGIHGGISTSPFGGIPIIGGSVNWKRKVFLEGTFGHTFWNNNYYFAAQTEDLKTKRRMFGGHLTYYITDNKKIGILGGWMRIEQISQKYYEYVRLSEGPLLGVKVTPFEFLGVMLAYNPSKHRIIEQLGFAHESVSKNGQFLFSIMLVDIFGGGE